MALRCAQRVWPGGIRHNLAEALCTSEMTLPYFQLMLRSHANSARKACKVGRECLASEAPVEQTHGRSEDMASAAAKVNAAKSTWQHVMSNIVYSLRPIAAMLKPVVMPILDAPSKKRVREAVNIYDLREAAQKRAHAMVFGYLDSGADAERALRRSQEAFNDVQLRHAVLHGVGNGDINLETKILGFDTRMPYFLTSCAGQRMFHADGEIASAKAAKKHGLGMALSQLTTSTFEEVREAHPDGAKALQLYVWRDRVLLKEVLDRAKNAGFTSLVLTADFSWVGNRERDTRTGFTVPPTYSMRQ